MTDPKYFANEELKEFGGFVPKNLIQKCKI